jgi:iron complex outermembrane receptor protein
MKRIIICTVLALLFTGLLSTAQESSDTVKLKEVVVTATKTERNPRDIPARVSVISSDVIMNSPAMQIDDIIRFTPGINVNRSTGIFSMRPMVTLRGLSGDEQSRTLVLVNGVPVNTSDEGGVNWNRINQNDIERVEVFKGPGSSLYGNNAMGGVINLITRKPVKTQEIFSSFSYGTFNTLRQDLNVRLRAENGYYGTLSQFFVKSDGYNNVPDTDRTVYDIDRFLEATGISARIGNDGKKWVNWELQYDIYRDKRGEGYQIYAPEGCYRNFNTNLLRGNLNGGNRKTAYTLNVFYQMENYYDINERMKGPNYSRYDVNSYRKDMGSILNINHQLIEDNTITGGFEYKQGSIEGGDYYQTAPYDTVYNAGKLNTLAGYIQDEHVFLNNKIRLVTGLRFDQVTFSDGDYYASDPWNTEPELKDYTWTELSPRAGLRFNFIEKVSAYLSYSHGFRASILDDLTRTGWMWVGPKYANPELEPESMNNYEIGFDLFPVNKLKLSLSAYMMQGKDFLYYVSTGDSIFGRPVFRRENVTNVNVSGVEAEVNYSLSTHFLVFAGYTFCESKIVGFEKRPDLENKYLKYTPKHSGSLSLLWQNKYVNFTARTMYKGMQYGDDENKVELKEYVSLDVMISKTFREKFMISFDVQNLLDEKFMETVNYLSPGRLMTGKISLIL